LPHIFHGKNCWFTHPNFWFLLWADRDSMG
jgi:hypothetical protein